MSESRLFLEAVLDRGRAALILFLLLSLVPSLYTADRLWFHTGISVRDYLNVWAGGHLAAAGAIQTIFNPALYWGWLKEHINRNIDLYTWSYPPTMLFVAVPFVHLGLLSGYLAYTAITLACFIALSVVAGVPIPLSIAAVISPAAVENALAGQNGALISALLVAGTLVAERSPVAGGVMTGLLAVKPQFGILLPVYLIAQRNWRAIVTATATVGTLTMLSGHIFGWQAWALFASQVTPFMTQQILNQAYDHHHLYQFMMVTPFILARWSGAGLPECYAFQAVATGVSALVAWRIWRIPHADPLMRMALTVCLTMWATPYAYTYDMIAIAVAAAVIGQAGWRDGFLPGELCLTVLVWLWPGCAILVGAAGFPPVGSILVGGLAFCAWRRLGRLPRLTPRFQPVGTVFDHPHLPNRPV